MAARIITSPRGRHLQYAPGMACASRANHQNPVTTFLLPPTILGVVTSLRTRAADRNVPEKPGRNSDITSHGRYRPPRPARVRPRPGDREGGGPERARVPRLASRAEPLRGH